MYFTGFADEASKDLDIQIKVTKELGWRHIETRAMTGGNLAGITERDFEILCAKLEAAGISFNCYGSGIANWSQPITEAPDKSYEEMRNAIPRMRKLGIKMVRIMSFAVPDELKPRSWDFFDEVVRRMKILTGMAGDAGIICLHENCQNWGGLSYEHTLRMLEAVNAPNLKLVFDTGNPVFSRDVRGKAPYKYQSAWEFYRNVKQHIAHIHIKDGRMDGEKTVFTFPGEGDGDVEAILTDLFRNGYDGGISIEPHMATVFHEKEASRNEELCYQNYLEYGRKIITLTEKIKSGL